MHLYGVLGWTALVAVLTVIPLSRATEHDDSEDCELGKRALHLEHRLATLQDKLNARGAAHRLREWFGLDKRLKEHEDGHCGESFHLCGYHTNQCVHQLLFCDGAEDCENGFDEKHCDIPFHEGELYHGHVVYDHCTKRRPEHVTFKVVKVEHSELSAPELEATFSVDLEDEHTRGATVFSIHGSYNYVHKLAFFAAPEKDGLGVEIDFGDHHADGFSLYVGSDTQERCAKFFFNKH